MNVYFVHEKYEYFGFLVIAETAGKAKALCQGDFDEDFICLRALLRKKNIGDKYEPQVLYAYEDKTNPILKELDLHYYDEDGNEI